jgi:Ni/Fe-hydrogenase subunit HybB-like protein
MRAEPLGGRILTRPFLVLLALGAIGCGLIGVRLFFGLAPISNLSDGYPWGIWKPLNVVIATGIGAGGYGMALIVYVLNRGKYHPLVRPALLTSALAYSVGGASVMVDLGRWWNVWRLPFVWLWNGRSILLEVSICVISYTCVLWIEVSPAFWEGLSARKNRFGDFALWFSPKLEKALPFIIALGVLLPTMHQSSLGGLFMVSSFLHPLWHSGFLPLLFLISCLIMGYSGVVLQDGLTRLILKRPQENDLLPRLSRLPPYLVAAYLAIRFGDLAWKGRLPLLFESGRFAFFFWIEIALAIAGSALLVGEASRRNPGRRFLAALSLILFGSLYRFDTYLIGIVPRGGWHYFPSFGEMFVSLGLWALAGCVFILVVKRFPVLAAPSSREPKLAHA